MFKPLMLGGSLFGGALLLAMVAGNHGIPTKNVLRPTPLLPQPDPKSNIDTRVFTLFRGDRVDLLDGSCGQGYYVHVRYSQRGSTTEGYVDRDDVDGC